MKTLQERKDEFTNKVMEKLTDTGKVTDHSEILKFVDYWTEHNEGGRKMRFEIAKNQPFNIGRRWGTWKANQKRWEKPKPKTGSVIDRLKKRHGLAL